MRRSLITAVVLAALTLPAGAVVATTPPDSTPPDSAPAETMTTEPVESMDTTPADSMAPTEASEPAPSDTTEATAAEAATIYDDSGNAIAEVTVVGTEPAWGDYDEDNDPDAGREYFRMTVSVASLITDGTFNVNVDHFILQDNNGFVTDAENIKTAAQEEADEDVTEDADLANGESVELTLTFEVVSSVGPQAVFYSPDDDRLVGIAQIG